MSTKTKTSQNESAGDLSEQEVKEFQERTKKRTQLALENLRENVRKSLEEKDQEVKDFKKRSRASADQYLANMRENIQKSLDEKEQESKK